MNVPKEERIRIVMKKRRKKAAATAEETNGSYDSIVLTVLHPYTHKRESGTGLERRKVGKG